MKSQVLTVLAAFIFLSTTNCAVTHERGNDPQVAIDYYRSQKVSIQNQVQEIIKHQPYSAGEITLQWTVDDKGRVKKAQITKDDLQNAQLNQLLLDHLNSLQFPKAPSFMSSTVEYSYKFQRK